MSTPLATPKRSEGGTPARSEMVEKVRALLARRYPVTLDSGILENDVDEVIAAVLDNLPREVMAKAAWEAYSVASPNAHHWPNWEELYEHGTKADRLAETDAAISAARREVLGHE